VPQATLARTSDAIDEMADALTVGRKDFIIDGIAVRIAMLFSKYWLIQKRLLIKYMDAVREQVFIEEAIKSVDATRLASMAMDRAIIEPADILTDPLRALLQSAYGEGYRVATKSTIGSSIGETAEGQVFALLPNPRAEAWAKQHAAELVANVNATTRKQINKLVTQAVSEGWSYNTLAKAIKTKFNEFAIPMPQQHIADRATLVAVTETAYAYEQGSKELYDYLADSGVQLMKRWIAAGDERRCDKCGANFQQGYIKYEEPFQSGHDMAPAHPACRCTVSSRVLDDNKIGRKSGTQSWTDEERRKAATKLEPRVTPPKPKPKPAPTPTPKPSGPIHRAAARVTQRWQDYDKMRASDNYAFDALGHADPDDLQTLRVHFKDMIDRLEQMLGVPSDWSKPQVFKTAMGKVKAAFRTKLASCKVATRVPTDVMPLILRDGKFKSQFESGRSMGCLSRQIRSGAEEGLFSVSEDIDDSLRPYYGYIQGWSRDSDRAVSSYGSSINVVFKDSVRKRTTFTLGDSLNNDGQIMPAHVADFGDDPRDLFVVQPRPWRTAGGIEREFAHDEYAEAQIHGGLTLDDIEIVQLRGFNGQAATWELEDIARQLDDAGIPYEWVDF